MEYVIINEEYIECSDVSTGINLIGFTVTNGDITDLVEKVKEITDLEVCGEDKVVYGVYGNLKFVSATIDADSNVTINMSIATNIEQRVAAIEESQEVQNEAIDSLSEMAGE